MNVPNQGINISGGTVNGPMAVGTGSRAVQNIGAPIIGTDRDQADELLASIRELVRRHDDVLGDADTILRDTDTIEAQVHSATPDRAVLSETLNRLTARVAAVTGLVEAVTALSGLILGG
ncbi:hypothetical protein ACLQ2R_13795 [Streptosporangium sp. DT93]|uniref:hypothetical protein n=1 Tax=Streptosporangium sp. DT93 TaxID=3393428 RepID=UPI003CF604BA